MSRVCVKGFPAYLSEDRLREQFSACGEVTDVKIIRTSDGRSRQLAFVGYRTEEEASSAVHYFNRSFIDTCRLTVEVARPIGDQNAARPWSRHSKGSSAYEKGHKLLENKEPAKVGQQVKATAPKDGKATKEEDPDLIEFLQVMQPRNKSKLWTNDTVTGKREEEKRSSKASEKKKHTKKGKESKAKHMDGRRKSLLKSEGSAEINEATAEDGNDEEDAVTESRKPCPDIEKLPAGMEDVARDEALSDLGYLKQRMKENWSDDDLNDEDSNDEQETISSDGGGESSSEVDNDRSASGGDRADDASRDNEPEDVNGTVEEEDPQQVHALEFSAEEQESVAETGRLFVRNLSYTTSEEDLEELFGQFGELSEVHLVLDKDTKRSKGFAYVLYMLPESAVSAMEALDKSIVQGRLLHILPAKRPPSLAEKDLKDKVRPSGTNQFKQDREAQRRASEASGNTQAWNALFMRQDTVAENIARRYGLSKSDLLNPEAEDLAVRMALGETQVIAETKKALSDEGINVEVLEGLVSGKLDRVKRSNHVVLVKNLPFSTLEADLVTMFGKYGSIDRVVLPPTKALALVIFLEASEARTAVKGLAYKRFRHVPLYLEWAPEDILREKSSQDADGGDKRPSAAIGEDQVKRAVLEQQLTAATDMDADYNPNESRTVFIKNLNFATSESALEQHLQKNLKEGSLRSITIKTKQHKSGKLLSMGFGFAEFDTPLAAKSACKHLQGMVLDGHALVLQLSRLTERTPAKKPSDNSESSTKLIVRNVAFEATKKDLQQLFSPFGQIKSLRLPKKFDGNHRGFAFLEFLTKQEATNAFNALASTHLYGRHLVIERAKESESLDELRARTATQFLEGDEGLHGSKRPAKKGKKGILEDGITRFEKVAY